jgi:hypothetical protein
MIRPGDSGMRARLSIPAAMIAYCHRHEVDPVEVAQFVLEEHGRECVALLLANESPWEDEEAARVPTPRLN